MQERHRAPVAVLALAIGGVLLLAESASAIPVFARKYETSCQTCHVAYPKLNAFGEAFRLRGYRMPGETAEMIKEKPVSLGAPAWKRVWPKAVWPSDIPGSTPLALRVNLPTRWTSEVDEDGHREQVKGDFRFPGIVYAQTAGTFGEKFSFFSKVQIERSETAELHGAAVDRHEEIEIDLEHAELHVNDIAGPEGALNLKVGRFEPEMVGSSFSHMRTLTDRNYLNLFAYAPIAEGGGSSVGSGGHHGGGDGIALPATVEGIEAYGVLKHRLLWNLGIANGLGPGVGASDGNSLKDFYGRLTYKFGGMGLDGTVGDEVATPEAQEPWRDNSFKIGIFVYSGNGEDVIFTQEEHGHGDEGGHDEGDDHEGDDHEGDDHEGDDHEGDDHADETPNLVPIEDEKFLRYGADFHWYIKDLHLFAVFVRGEDTLRTFDSEAWMLEPGHLELHSSETFDYDTFLVEADYVFQPWLHGVLRYEYLDFASEEAGKYEWATANLTALVRANIKAYVEWQQDLKVSENYALTVGLDFAY